jgi:type IV pilus assembly protein PilV
LQRRYRARRHGVGFTLIEILVSLLLLSFGLLGMVALQAGALQGNREARLQVLAIRLATELSERMQGNRAIAMQPSPTENPYLLDDFNGAAPSSTADCILTGCGSPLDTARGDIAEWLTQLVDTAHGGLPGPRATVCFDEAPYDLDGRPHWECTHGGGTVQIKLGWRRGATDRSKTGSDAIEDPNARDSRPLVSMPAALGIPS